MEIIDDQAYSAGAWCDRHARWRRNT